MKQKAKRLSALILSAVIILSLTACQENKTSVSEGNISSGISENNTSGDTSKPQNNMTVENTGNKVDDTLPQCEPANIIYLGHKGSSIMKSTEGYYYCDHYLAPDQIGSSYAPFYYDLQSGKSIILCSKPQCLHNCNEFCTATAVPERSFVWENGYYLYNGYIYRISKENYVSTEKDGASIEHIRLYRFDLKGTERSEIAELADPAVLGDDDTKTVITNIIFHYGKMFFVKSVGGRKNAEIFMLDIESGDVKKINVPDAKKYENYPYMTADGDWLYYAVEDITYDKINKSMISNLATVLHRFNIKTGETEVITALPDTYSSFAVNDGIIYYTTVDRKNNVFSLCAYDTEKNKTETFIENNQQELLDGKYLSDSSVNVCTDRKYLYISVKGYNSSFIDGGDFYIYSLDGKELLHGLKGLPDVEQWEFYFRALDGEIYVDFEDRTPSEEETKPDVEEDVIIDFENPVPEEEDLISGVYVIKAEDLINGSTAWKRLYAGK